MAKIAAGHPVASQGGSQSADACDEKSLEGWRGYANTSWGSRDTDCSLRLLSSVYVRKSSKEGRLELCCAHLADGMAELPRFKPCFSEVLKDGL